MTVKARIPNILTIGRILSIPLIMYGILTQEPPSQNFMAIALFLLAILTDFLDGYLARRWNVTSDFGRMIDPIADKLLIAGCVIALAIYTQGSWIILIPGIAIIFRDILVSGAREHAALSSRMMPPTQLAKWKTACEMLALLLLITFAPIAISPLFHVGLGLLWLAALLSVYTGTLYFRAALKD